MPHAHELQFGLFRLDVASERLWCATQELRLRPKSFAVLVYLVQRAGQLVTKDEILEALWPGLAMDDGALTTCLREIRRMLGDNPRQPKIIETVHRRGYRVIAAVWEVGADPEGTVAGGAAEPEVPRSPQSAARRPVAVVGREATLQRLHAWFALAQRGERRVVFVTGEPGIGKTTVVDQFLAEVASGEAVWLPQGECVEQYGAAEPYLPVLAALGGLCRGPGGNGLLTLLGRHAPTWLVLLGTYRPVDVIVREHPLRVVKHELALHGQCEEVSLEPLTEPEVAGYLARRLAGSALPLRLVQTLHRRTDGHPLFLVTVVDEWVRRGWLVEEEGRWHVHAADAEMARLVPERVRQMIGQQLDGLSEADRRLLEAASVAGMTFSAAAVAAAIEGEVEGVEERCAALAQRGQWLAAAGVAAWPDGTVAEQYRFLHALHRQVVYERVPARHGSRLHQRIGAREEVGYGAHATERAAELAVHFEQGREAGRAVTYHRHAAAQALRRWAYRETIEHLTRGVALLGQLPDSPEHRQAELECQIALGAALMVSRGYAAPEVAQAYTRARDLCQQVGDTPQLAPALYGLWTFSLNRVDYATARALAEHLLSLAHAQPDPAIRLAAHRALGTTLALQGELAAARTHLEQGVALEAEGQLPWTAFLHGQDPTTCLGTLAHVLWLLGYPDQALRRSQEAVAMAHALAHPAALAFALFYAAVVYQYRREGPATQRVAEELLTVARQHGFPLRLARGMNL